MTILNSIDPNFSAIIWLTQTTLKEQTTSNFFSELDYLFDGLLSNHCQQNSINQNKTLFSTKNFNNNIFLGHLCTTNPNYKDEFSALIELINMKKHRDTLSVKIINTDQENNNVIEKLKRKYPKIKFTDFSPV